MIGAFLRFSIALQACSPSTARGLKISARRGFNQGLQATPQVRIAFGLTLAPATFPAYPI